MDDSRDADKREKSDMFKENIKSHEHIDYEIRRLIREVGFKATQPRVDILKVLYGVRSKEVTVKDVYEALAKHGKDIGFATVYRFLRVLCRKGIVEETILSERSVKYRLIVAKNFDQIICNSCGKIIEFREEKIKNLNDQIAEKYGFKVDSHRFALYGICDECSSSEFNEEP